MENLSVDSVEDKAGRPAIPTRARDIHRILAAGEQKVDVLKHVVADLLEWRWKPPQYILIYFQNDCGAG